MQHILIVGYGKIGAIKAEIWTRLGAQVHIYDRRYNSSIFRNVIEQKRFSLFDPEKQDDLTSFIVDISTPADQHAAALRWAFYTLKNPPKVVLIEKPAVSSVVEKFALLEIVNSFAMNGILVPIILNESYYVSTALRELRKLLEVNAESPLQINIELSKNRLSDNDNGRFFDYELGALGIETPHMVAILQYFNITLESLKELQPHRYIDPTRNDNQGITVTGKVNDCTISLASYLGNFRLSNHDIRSNPAVTRSVMVRTAQREYHLAFDILDVNNTHHTKLIVTDLITAKTTQKLIKDNHLQRHLADILTNNVQEQYVGLENSLAICDVLFTWQANAVCKKIDTRPIGTVINADKEYTCH
ncbi:MAG TPA: hypothetical protein VNE40_01010 [Candidatus Dormibacteraeota bacterium]|nr:hypothetical protein [Candidatus Dormibacteraeota bacterium]